MTREQRNTVATLVVNRGLTGALSCLAEYDAPQSFCDFAAKIAGETREGHLSAVGVDLVNGLYWRLPLPPKHRKKR